MFAQCPLEGTEKCIPGGSPLLMTKVGGIEPPFQRRWDCIWGLTVSQQGGRRAGCLNKMSCGSPPLCLCPVPQREGHHQPPCEQKGQVPLALRVPLHLAKVGGYETQHPEW